MRLLKKSWVFAAVVALVRAEARRGRTFEEVVVVFAVALAVEVAVDAWSTLAE